MLSFHEILIDVTRCLQKVVGLRDYDDTPNSSDADSWRISDNGWKLRCDKIDECLENKRDVYSGVLAARKTNKKTYKQKYAHIPTTIATYIYKKLNP